LKSEGKKARMKIERKRKVVRPVILKGIKL